MKVSIGMKLQPGAWGGGNQFGHALADYLRSKGVQVCFDLKERDLDIAVLTGSLSSASYTYRELSGYLLRRNRRTVVVHRINECDERKGTTGVNQRLKRANMCSDHTIFISGWLRDLFLGHGLETSGYTVIHNGANPDIFNAKGYRRWDRSSKIKLVTHHWGGGRLKGFDIYECLDKMLSVSRFRKRIELTYIGNLPPKFFFKNAFHIPPKSGVGLAATIRSHHVYLTASQNEPAGMHHIEGAMCGLPLLYRESGALPEYCNGFGISFTEEDFEQKLEEMMEKYDYWADRMKEYHHTSEQMCEEYYNVFVELLDRRDEILERRRLSWQPTIIFQSLLPQPVARAFDKLGLYIYRNIR